MASKVETEILTLEDTSRKLEAEFRLHLERVQKSIAAELATIGTQLRGEGFRYTQHLPEVQKRRARAIEIGVIYTKLGSQQDAAIKTITAEADRVKGTIDALFSSGEAELAKAQDELKQRAAEVDDMTKIPNALGNVTKLAQAYEYFSGRAGKYAEWLKDDGLKGRVALNEQTISQNKEKIETYVFGLVDRAITSLASLTKEVTEAARKIREDEFLAITREQIDRYYAIYIEPIKCEQLAASTAPMLLLAPKEKAKRNEELTKSIAALRCSMTEYRRAITSALDREVKAAETYSRRTIQWHHEVAEVTALRARIDLAIEIYTKLGMTPDLGAATRIRGLLDPVINAAEQTYAQRRKELDADVGYIASAESTSSESGLKAHITAGNTSALYDMQCRLVVISTKHSEWKNDADLETTVADIEKRSNALITEITQYVQNSLDEIARTVEMENARINANKNQTSTECSALEASVAALSECSILLGRFQRFTEEDAYGKLVEKIGTSTENAKKKTDAYRKLVQERTLRIAKCEEELHTKAAPIGNLILEATKPEGTLGMFYRALDEVGKIKKELDEICKDPALATKAKPVVEAAVHAMKNAVQWENKAVERITVEYVAAEGYIKTCALKRESMEKLATRKSILLGYLDFAEKWSKKSVQSANARTAIAPNGNITTRLNNVLVKIREKEIAYEAAREACAAEITALTADTEKYVADATAAAQQVRHVLPNVPGAKPLSSQFIELMSRFRNVAAKAEGEAYAEYETLLENVVEAVESQTRRIQRKFTEHTSYAQSITSGVERLPEFQDLKNRDSRFHSYTETYRAIQTPPAVVAYPSELDQTYANAIEAHKQLLGLYRDAKQQEIVGINTKNNEITMTLAGKRWFRHTLEAELTINKERVEAIKSVISQIDEMLAKYKV